MLFRCWCLAAWRGPAKGRITSLILDAERGGSLVWYQMVGGRITSLISDGGRGRSLRKNWFIFLKVSVRHLGPWGIGLIGLMIVQAFKQVGWHFTLPLNHGPCVLCEVLWYLHCSLHSVYFWVDTIVKSVQCTLLSVHCSHVCTVYTVYCTQ